MKSIKKISQKTLLVILDGFGINQHSSKNAIACAKKPNLDNLFSHYPYTTIEAGGEFVGLPSGVMGNSEVGHMNIGAGRPVRQDLIRINEAIENKNLETLPQFQKLVEYAKSHNNKIHLMGLLSDGGVHSHIDHINYIAKALKNLNIEVFLHAYMDGRDTQKTNGIKYVEALKDLTLASMQGRSIGMDRDRRWEKIELAYKTIVGLGKIIYLSPQKYLESEYKKEIYDEFITPALFNKDFALQDNEAMFFINFRPDRARQISYAFCDPKFNHFEITTRPGFYLCMTPYIDEDVELPILFDKEPLSGTLSEYLSKLGHKQFKIAETEKYAHVTYFFNGGAKAPFEGETHKMIPSPKDVATYDEKPEMSSSLITKELLQALDEDYKFLCVNYANCDMVGHTGNFEATIKAVEAVDACVGELIKKCDEKAITLILTADHGNADEMAYEDSSPQTSHSKAPVPFAVYHPTLKDVEFELSGKAQALKDIAPTVLYTLGIEYPKSFIGKSVFR